jgi:hypothetical protein
MTRSLKLTLGSVVKLASDSFHKEPPGELLATWGFCFLHLLVVVRDFFNLIQI